MSICPNCGLTRGVHSSILPGCMCQYSMQLPPKKEWVGLTNEEILEEHRQSYGDDGDLTDVYFARAIEAKLKEKNNGS